MSERAEKLPNNMLTKNEACCNDNACCPTKTPNKRDTPKIGRNDPCICGNGIKYKRCCGKNL